MSCFSLILTANLAVISIEWVLTIDLSSVEISHGNLHLPNVAVRWLAKMLKAGMMENREIKLMHALLTRYNFDPDDFHFRSVICDGTQLYRSIPENKQEATECKHHI